MDTKEITVSDLAQEQIKNAERLFPLIRKKTEERKEKKTVISVSGGSGVGKTGMAFLLQNMFEKQGKKSLIISGDNYPHRIPMYNDAERIARFRMSGLNGLITERLYTDEIKEKLLELQKGMQKNRRTCSGYPYIRSMETRLLQIIWVRIRNWIMKLYRIFSCSFMEGLHNCCYGIWEEPRMISGMIAGMYQIQIF